MAERFLSKDVHVHCIDHGGQVGSAMQNMAPPCTGYNPLTTTQTKLYIHVVTTTRRSYRFDATGRIGLKIMTLTRNTGRELPSYIATMAVADSYSHYKNWDLEDGSVTLEHCLVFPDPRWPIMLSVSVQLCMCATQRRPSTLPVPLQLHAWYCKWYTCTSPAVILPGAPLYGNSTQPHQ